jgi:ribonuclease P protein component
MIARKFRLPRQKFSERSFDRINSDYFLVKVFENELGHNRFGVVIGAKVDKRSSRRNFWRRTILHYAKRQVNFGKDLIIIVSPRICELSKNKVEQELEKIFKKIQTSSQ